MLEEQGRGQHCRNRMKGGIQRQQGQGDPEESDNLRSGRPSLSSQSDTLLPFGSSSGHAPATPGPLHLLSSVSRMLISQLCSVAFQLRCHGPLHLEEPFPQHTHSHFLSFTPFSFSLFEMVTLSLGQHMWSVLQPQWKFHTGKGFVRPFSAIS